MVEVYGDRFTVIDASGKTMVDARDGDSMVQPGATLSERDVIRHCLAHLESHMAPRHVAFIDDLPRTDNGKPTRKGLP